MVTFKQLLNLWLCDNKPTEKTSIRKVWAFYVWLYL